MLDFVCAIPKEIGWALVGASAMLCLVMAIDLGKTIIKAIKERMVEDEDEEEDEEEESAE